MPSPQETPVLEKTKASMARLVAPQAFSEARS